MRFDNGDILGPYEIVAPVGAGGMGEVYRAHDARLGRDVAIKVLPASRGTDAQALARFEREAKAVAALSHPNILAIHDFGHEGDVVYTVTELLEGETLGQRLAATAIPVRKAIEIGTLIARGLAAAHAQGIVHRDVKPDNIFLTHDGQVKILDFGLAAMDEAPVGEGDRTLTQMPGRTDPGTVLGTVGYMSPEQVRGQPTDHRSDIFTLGAILYETLAGRRAFSGETAADVSSAILGGDPPDLSESNRDVPPAIELLLRRCLEKNPAERFQSASDLAFGLEQLSGFSAATAQAASPPNGLGRGLGMLALLLGVISIVGAVAAAYWIGSRDSVSEAPSFTRLTFQNGTVRSARIAPDGQTIVYGAAWEGDPIRVYSTRTGSPISSRVDLPDADILAVSSQGEMAISIDRRFLSPYQSTGTLARVPLAGGAPRLLLENVQQADWSPDGNELVVVHEVEGRNRLEYPIGTVLYETAGWISSPRFSPDGRHIAFLDHDLRWDNRSRVTLIDPDGGNLVHLGAETESEGLAWSPSGSEIWFDAGLDSTARGLYVIDLAGNVRKLYQQAPYTTLLDVHPDGRVLANGSFPRREMRFGAAEIDRDLSWLDWSLPTFLSRDGASVLINEQGEGGENGLVGYAIYLRKTNGAKPIHIGQGIPMGLSPDGSWVLTRRPDKGLALLPTGPGAPREITPATDGVGAMWGGFSPDGRSLVYSIRRSDETAEILLVDIEDDSETRVAEGLSIALFSDPFGPEGKRILGFDSARSFHIVPLDGTPPMPIEGLQPGDEVSRWSDNGRYLFFYRQGMPGEYGRLELATHRREILGTLAPPDRAGAMGILPVLFSGDGSAYAYSYPRLLTGLYVIEGLN